MDHHQQPPEESFQVGAHVRIGILLNEQRCGCVPHVECEEAVAETVIGNPRFNGASEVVESTVACANAQFVLRLA
jgi:hypothetical protein